MNSLEIGLCETHRSTYCRVLGRMGETAMSKKNGPESSEQSKIREKAQNTGDSFLLINHSATRFCVRAGSRSTLMMVHFVCRLGTGSRRFDHTSALLLQRDWSSSTQVSFPCSREATIDQSGQVNWLQTIVYRKELGREGA
jgi:hypothetical protein